MKVYDEVRVQEEVVQKKFAAPQILATKKVRGCRWQSEEFAAGIFVKPLFVIKDLADIILIHLEVSG